MSGLFSGIEVLYALCDKRGNYSKVAGTSLCSLMDNTSSAVRIHLFHDGSVQGENRRRFEKLVSGYGQEIIFYNVRELLPEVWQEAEQIFPRAVKDERFTEATLYRLLAPQILPEEVSRVIYLDADTIVNLDIRELWEEEIGASGLAAVREADVLAHYGLRGQGEAADVLARRMEDRGVDLSTYFNAGVLLLDLTKLRGRENLLISGFKLLAKHPDESGFYDQSILNYYFAQSLRPLSWRYNIMINWDKKYGRKELYGGIYHYLGNHLGLDKDDPRDLMYFQYFLKTPWCNAAFFCQFFNSFVNLFKGYYTPRAVEQSMLMIRMCAVLSRKSLVIAGTEEFKPQLMELLKNPMCLSMEAEGKQCADYFLGSGIRFCSLGSNKHIDLNLTYDVGTYLYLLFVPDYPRISCILKSAGLEEGEDYLDGAPLLEDSSCLELIIRPQIVFEKL